ncbi:hypothetical protein, partial [Kistimonas scapharcae]|uniref:hypothetical protein n=1 Tax=Kistimonas scapharcae TaxID=1036133 RepID=UPI0031EA8E27
MQGLCPLPGLVLAGFTGNTVRLSEPRVPYAWPLDYQYPVPQGNIVAISPVSGGLFVATDDKPYLLQGSTPAAMVMVPIESNQACVSRDSMVDMGDYCIYASPDGLVVGQANTATLTTESFVTKHEWSDFQPETIRAWQYEGKYIARTDSGKGFVYDLRGETATLTTLDFDPIAAYFDSSSDSLYFADAAGDV